MSKNIYNPPNLKKMLDRKKKAWYNNKVVSHGEVKRAKARKKSKEILKNLLTRAKRYDIISKLSHESNKQNLENWTMKYQRPLKFRAWSESGEWRVKQEVKARLKNANEESVVKYWTGWFKTRKRLNTNLLKSLILAQDERWRHA